MPPDVQCFDQGGRSVRWDTATSAIVPCSPSADAGPTVDAGTGTTATHQPFRQGGRMVIWDPAQGRIVPYTGSDTTSGDDAGTGSGGSSDSDFSVLDWIQWPTGILLFGSLAWLTRSVVQRRSAVQTTPVAEVNRSVAPTEPVTDPVVVEPSVEELARARDDRIADLIRAEIPNYESLQREAKLAINESIPELRAAIYGTWRRQGALRRGRAETDPVTSEIVRIVMESRRNSHTWMAEHLPGQRREETSRERVRRK